MNAKSANLYQNGVIDTFKLFKVYDLNIHQVNINGEVQCVMDNEIGRKIIKVTGNLSVTNYLEIPNNKFTKSLNYSGKYYYIFFKTFPDKKFSFQMSYIINNDALIKFTFKYPLKSLKFTRTNSFNVDIPINFDNSKWTILKFDPVDYINMYLVKQFKEFSVFGGLIPENVTLRSVQFWSTLYIRGVYISNMAFLLETLPKEMAVKVSDQSNPYNNLNFFEFISLEDRAREGIIKQEIKEEFEEADESINKNERETSKSASKNNQKIKKKNVMENYDASLSEIERKSRDLKEENLKLSKENIVKSTIQKLDMTNSRTSFNNSMINKMDDRYNLDLKEMNNEMLKKNMDNINREFANTKKEMIKNIFKRDEVKRKPLLPDPMMHLKFILGYTAISSPGVKFHLPNFDQNSNSKKNIIFASGNTLINFDYTDLRQKFYFGHSKPIINYVLGCEGEILFSCQEGKNSIIRIWRVENARCIKMLTTPYEHITCMSISKDSKLLCTVGLESYNRELIILWDISNLDEITVYVRQSSHFSISMIKFSPFEQNILVSCGKENIKFWRIKRDHLGGKAVVLNQYARENMFTCLDYDNPFVGDEFNKGKVFIGSNKGCVYQISCNTEELEAIYKIQDSSILSICVNDAFCATGSLDGFLRVWPIDFKEFLIEAKHDSGVCSVDIAYDGLEILCGTLNGSIGILNIQTKQYKTILRTPPSKVQFMIAHPSGNYLLTIEDDKSVRVWDVENKSEAFQFISTKDPPTAIGVPNSSIFTCGFTSGLLKIFDLEKTSILYECKSFNTPIKHLKYTQNDSYLISMNSQGHMSIHDTKNNYIQIKLIKIDEPTPNTDISLNNDADYFATIGPEANCVLVWNSTTYGIKNRIPINNFFVHKLCLINKNILAVILDNCSVNVYSLVTHDGILIKEFNNIHINKINDFLITKNYKYLISGGEEGMIKIWDSKMLFKTFTSYQQFIGHSTGIRSIICLEQKSLLVTISENSGIYFWNFLGDVTFCETEITQEFEKLGNIKYMRDEFIQINKNPSRSASTNLMKSQNSINNIKSAHLERTYLKDPNNNITLGNTEKRMKINFEEENEQSMQILNMLPVESEEKEGFGVDMTYSQSGSQFLGSDAFNNINILNSTQVNADDLSNKLLFSEKYIPSKIEKFVIPKQTSDKLEKQLILGYSVNSIKNIVLNKENNWFAFTVNNKLIVEYLEQERRQIILEGQLDEISCLVISNDLKYLVSGSGFVNKEESAPICIWDSSTWQLKKKLNFHYKGIQIIKFSNNGKYMISAGNKEEKSICVWNFSNLTVIDSKSLKFPIIDLVCEKSTNDVILYFVTISFEVISFWRMDSNYRLEGFHIKFEDFTHEREEGEIFTSLEITPYYDRVKTSFVMLGTNLGAVLVVDKEKKILLRKYYISKSPITKLVYFDGTFICAGQNPIIYSWKFDSGKIDHEYVFDFFEREKSKLIFVDSNTISLDFRSNGNEGLIGTDSGSIFYANLNTESTIKIINSHKNCFINSIDCDYNNSYILTSGDDGTVRCWTQDTFDQKFQFMKLYDSKCDSALINHADNMCIVIYNSSYLRVYNMNSLKSVGKIKIPENDVNTFSFIFNYQGMIITTLQDKIFIFDVQNWDPLSVLYTEIANSFMPKNQFFKSIDTKNLDLNRSLAVMSFSDGTTCVIAIEKIKGKIETSILDMFNMFEYHISKSDDVHIAEMYQNLTKFRTNYTCCAKFSQKYEDLLFGFHECLQFLYIRDYSKNQVYRRIPLNFFPSSISISENDNYIALGTKEGLILFITRLENSFQSGFNLDIFSGHYDLVKTIHFNQETSKLFSSSYSEIIVWNINLK